MTNDLITAAEAAREVGIPYSRLYYWMLARRVPTQQIGRRRYVSLSEVKAAAAAPGEDHSQGTAAKAVSRRLTA
jgi:hypothetical protein